MKKIIELYVKNRFVFFLFVYHFLFTFLTYDYYKKNNGDASLYWFVRVLDSSKTWFDYLTYGTDFFLFLNYPFAEFFHLPVIIGFVFHSLIGFFGILLAYKLFDKIIGNQLEVKNLNLLPLLFLFPNLHFWTAFLGKESLVFLLATCFIYLIYFEKIISFKMLFVIVLLLLIRPHVALLLTLSLLLGLMIWNSKKIKHKVMFFSLAISCTFIATYFLLQLSKIKRIDFERIKRFNDFSITSFSHSNSYVPMLEYNWIEKIFAFNFRPLIYEFNGLYSLVVSLENTIVLMIHVLGIIGLIVYNKKIKLPFLFKLLMLFGVVCTFAYVQRYACLGIFLRTKIIFQPFLTIIFLYIFVQSVSLYKARKIKINE